MPEARRIFQHGGSACITLPRGYCIATNIRVGDVTLLVLGSDGCITVKKAPDWIPGGVLQNDELKHQHAAHPVR